MSTSRALADRIANLPFGLDTGHRRFAVDTSSDYIDLAPGAYEVFNGGTVAAYARLRSAVSIPADKADEVAGQWVIPAGASVTLVTGVPAGSDTAVKLYAITVSSSTTLDLHRKPL